MSAAAGVHLAVCASVNSKEQNAHGTSECHMRENTP